MKTNEQIKEDTTDLFLYKIADILAYNSSFIRNDSLTQGKIGIALFLYKYSHLSGNNQYALYANELVKETIENIEEPLKPDFKLIEIGIGLQYMIKKNYIDSESKELLLDFDASIENHFSSMTVENLGSSIFLPIIYWRARGDIKKIKKVVPGLSDICIEFLQSKKTKPEYPEIFSSEILQPLLAIFLTAIELGINQNEIADILQQIIIIRNKKEHLYFYSPFNDYLLNYLSKHLENKLNIEIETVAPKNEGYGIGFFRDMSVAELKYNYQLPFPDFSSELNQITKNNQLLDSLFQLMNLDSLGINNYLPGLAWAILEYRSKQAQKTS